MPRPDEAERPIDTFLDTDSRGNRNFQAWSIAPCSNHQIAPIEALPILCACYGERLSELAGAVCQSG